MDLKEYVTKHLIEKFGVHSSYSRVVKMVLLAEEVGDEAFKIDKFDTPRERAAFAMPYQVEDIGERERVLNFLELLILKHRQEKHGEDWSNRIRELQENTEFTEMEKELLIKPTGFWGG